MDTIFRLSNLLVLPFWAMMILLPRWRGTRRAMQTPLVSVVLALVYGALALPRLRSIWPVVSQPTVGGVAGLLASPAGTTIAWVHFLAFDLFVGRWIYLDSQERRIRVWLTSPTLFLTLMLGPIGFLLYLVVRAFAGTENPQRSNISPAGTGDTPSAFAAEPQVGLTAKAFAGRLRRAFEVSRPLTILGVVMVLTSIATLAGLFLDRRVVTSAPVWLKPAKFAISVSVYSFTFVWLLGFVENRRRLVRTVANVTAISLIVEMIAIISQAARGTTSHFNIGTAWNSVVWFSMGSFIVLVWVMTLIVAIVLVRQSLPDRAFAWSLRLGLFISLVGMAAAFFMVRPTPDQAASIARGSRPRIVGAHTVGVPDGGPGLPIVGWSTVGGDLRVPHFIGLHALQVLPFFGWWLTSNRRSRQLFIERQRLALVWIAALAYLGFVVLLAWQALRGQSVVHPGTTTIAAAGSVAAVTAIAALVVIRGAMRGRNGISRTPVEVAGD